MNPLTTAAQAQCAHRPQDHLACCGDSGCDASPRPRAARFPSMLIDRITWADGREVVVRPVLALDAPAQQAFVRALSMESRRRRFHIPLRELPPSLLRQMTDVDHIGHVAIVAEAIDEDDDTPTIVAEARYVRAGEETHLAIAVADAWQRRGLGRALMARLLRHASRHGVGRLVADMLAGNAAMARLAESFGGRLGGSPEGPGVTRASFVLDPGRRGAPPGLPAPRAARSPSLVLEGEGR